jgi:hypothetical protein
MRKYINLQGQPKRKRALLRSNPPGIGSDGRKCIGRNSKLTSFDFDYSFHFPNFIKYIFVPKCLKKPICKSSKMKFLNLPVYTVKLTLSVNELISICLPVNKMQLETKNPKLNLKP